MSDRLSSFIQSVGSSNLETFHSKALAWTLHELDSKSGFFKWLFKKATGRDCVSCVYHGSVAEVSQHDLVTTLSVEFREGNWETHVIIWENKIKADFSQKAVSQLPKSTDSHTTTTLRNYEGAWLRGISQPYWYQIRWLLWVREHHHKWKRFLKDACPRDESKPQGHQILPTEVRGVHWLILSPFKEEELNIFYNNCWSGSKWRADKSAHLKGDRELVKSIAADEDALNDWRFCSYEELFDAVKNHLDEAHYQTVLGIYIEYVQKNLSSTERLFSNDEENNSNPWTPSRMLEVYEKLKDDPRFMFYWSIGGSAHVGLPLLNISMRLGGNFESVSQSPEIHWIQSDQRVAKSSVDYVMCSIQIQKTVKLQFAHKAYDYVKIASSESYAMGVHGALGNNKSNDKSERISFIQNQLAVSGKFKVSKENLPNTKTGLSYSVLLEKGDLESTDDIVHLVQLTAQAFAKSR